MLIDDDLNVDESNFIRYRYEDRGYTDGDDHDDDHDRHHHCNDPILNVVLNGD